jgi:hypothetical protein
MEVLSDEGDIIFDVSITDHGGITVNTFDKDVDADLVIAAIEAARRPR